MSRRGLIITLIVSLAVNLFVIGGVAGAALMLFRMRGGPPPGPRPPMFAMAEDTARDLTPEHRELWLTTLRQAAMDAGPRLRQAHELRRQAWLKLAADPVDVNGVLAELTQARDLEGQARSGIDHAVATFAGGLPTDEREKLADKLSRARLGPRMLFSRHGVGPGRAGGPGVGPENGGPPPPDQQPLPDR